MVDDAAPIDSPPPPPMPRRRRRYAWWLGGGAALLVVLAAIAVGVLLWALRTAAGSAWVVTLAPQLKVVAPRGSLLGDFSAERIDITLPGSSGVLRLDGPRWQALAASRGTAGRWARLTIASLHADRVALLPGEAAPTERSAAATPPETLRLPVEIDVREASVDELRIGAGDDAFALRALRGRVHLGADGGALHRFSALQASHARADASGEATVGADPPFAIDARVRAVSAATSPAWQASVSASGPLGALAVEANAQVAPATTQAAQSLDAKAVVRPFAAWPLGELQASTEALDLSVFTSDAPATSLSGRATATTSGLDRPALIVLDLRNARAGRWNEGLLPVQRLDAELRARPDDPGTIEVQRLAAELGSGRLGGGKVSGSGRWTADRWNLELELDQLRPSALDARAPETVVDGKLAATGTGFAAATMAESGRVELRADLSGRLADRRLPRSAPQTARIRLEASGGTRELLLQSAEASLGAARATLAGRLSRASADAPWHASGKTTLVDFDPAPWWPGGPDSLLARGANRLNMKGAFDLDLPLASAGSAFQLLAATRGKASLALAESLLAGVPLQGEASYANSNGDARSSVELLAAGNRLHAQGQLAARPVQDAWQLSVDAAQLARLSPLLEAPRKGAASAPLLAGTLTASGRIEGRWPDLRSDGELQAATLRLGPLTVRRGEGRWRVGSAAEAPVSGTLALDGVDLAGRAIERVRAELSGTGRSHKAELRIESNALPPEWIDTIATQRSAAVPPAASPASAPAGAAPSPASPTASRSAVVVRLEGGLVDVGDERAAGWRGTVHELLAQSLAPPARTWLRAQALRGSYFWSGGPPRASVEPGSAEALGATLRWSQVAWQAGDGRGSSARLEATASIDPLPIAPLLRAVQPDFGWSGDLAVKGRLEAHGAPTVRVDAVIERASGDLGVTDEYGTQQLGLTDLRLGVAADDGVWNLTMALAGESLGVASGAVTARTSPTAAWPEARTPVEGVLEVRVANLGTWGRWVPAGWRLTGDLHASAAIGGRFGAPEYTGRIEGAHLGVRNFLQGVNVREGSVAIALQGSSARIEKFTARGGSGSVSLAGEASFDEAPAARLQLTAERFEMLGRVDRRIVTSGTASLRLDATTLALEGRFGVDEGLVDFSHSDAPSLGDDVEVVRRPTGATASAPVPAGAASAAATAAPVPTLPPTARKVDLDLRVAMGEKLRIRGRGLDAGLRGELHITSPGGRLNVDGSLRAVNGTYQAYGQKLGIDRGELAFVGPIENPRLDIEATRPNLDVRVGVQVTGTALNPRVRLFSEPDMSDMDKLSWLLLGRANDTTGGADTALLQRAALALLAGEGKGPTEQFTQTIGLDEISVRQQTEGDTKETIVKVGKQLSKDWYIGYERGLNATTGSWQLIYRLARQLTVRAQAGGDNSLDLIWTLRWK